MHSSEIRCLCFILNDLAKHTSKFVIVLEYEKYSLSLGKNKVARNEKRQKLYGTSFRPFGIPKIWQILKHFSKEIISASINLLFLKSDNKQYIHTSP